MRDLFNRMSRLAMHTGTGLCLLIWAGLAHAQDSGRQTGGGSSSGGGGSSFSGGSGGSFSGGSGGSFSGGSFSGSGSFSGGSFSGGSFSGGSMSGGSFSGGSFTGSSMQGNTGRSMSGGSSSIFTNISTTNPFRTYYANPLALGLQVSSSSSSNATRTTSGTATFGMPTYGTPSSTQNSSTRNTGTTTGTASAFSPIANTSGTKVLFVGAGSRPAPGPTVLVTSGRLFEDVRGALARSTAIASKDNIQFGVEGRTVVLRGTVADERERLRG